MTAHRFHGVYPVLYAFWTAAGRLDHAAMRAQVEHCVAAGAHGIMVLGLVTEVNRICSAERMEIVQVVGDALAGRVPYAVTVGEPEAAAQIAFAREAKAHGADWVILQPPPGKGHAEADLLRHFGTIADALDVPCAIQNNPVMLDSALSPDALAEAVRRHPNISVLKAEGATVDVVRTITALEGRIAAFGGHGGLEYLSLLRGGAAGLIPAPDVLAAQIAIYRAFRHGTPESLAWAEEMHRALLPFIVFMTRGIGSILTYGRRVMARRLGLDVVHPRLAGQDVPTPFGLAETERLFADVLSAEGRLL
jgi:4-hydroxy-tetrahydrodipicolinate synthase